MTDCKHKTLGGVEKPVCDERLRQLLLTKNLIEHQGKEIEMQIKIILELFDICKKLGGKSDLLSILGSYKDTLSDDEILNYLKQYNKGEYNGLH